jgi:glutamyl-tRNA reductase
VLIDIAVPRDVDPRVAELPGVRLHNIDDLRRVAETNLNGRRREAARAETIVAAEVRRFMAWRRPRLNAQE